MTLTCDNMEGYQKHSTNQKDPESMPHGSINMLKEQTGLIYKKQGNACPLGIDRAWRNPVGSVQSAISD